MISFARSQLKRAGDAFEATLVVGGFGVAFTMCPQEI
jgi:hypothetical protein